MADGDQPRGLRPREGAGATSRLLEELLAEGTPVAEIAVRLGISVPDAHARIGLTRGGETGGVEPAEPGGLPPSLARAAAPGTGGSQARAGRGLPGGGTAPRQAPPPEPRRGLSRRAFLALASAGVAGLAAGGAFLATRGSEETERAASPARPVPVPPTLTPVPPPLAALRPATGVFRELALDPGQPLTEEHGIFFMHARGEGAGSIRGWQQAEPGSDPPAYRTSMEGRFVATANAIHDRTSGQSWVWPGEELRLVGFSEDAALFELLREQRMEARVRTGRYVLTDGNLEERAVFDLKGEPLPTIPAMFEPGGRRAYLALDQNGRYPALFHLDGARAEAKAVLAPQQPTALRRALFHAPTPLADGSGILIPYSYWPLRPQGIGYGVFATFVARFGWEGVRQSVTRIRVDRAFTSPDGAYLAGERVLHIPESSPPAYEKTSTVIVIDGTTGRNLFRIRSARLNYGDELGGARWLADSSGLVIQSRIGGKVGYSIVDTEGSRLEPLPDPPRRSDEWFAHPDIRGGVASPDDPALISFGRTDVYDRRSGRWASMAPEAGAPAHLAPWTQTRGEMVLALPHQPHRVLPLLADLEETHIEHTSSLAGTSS